MRIGELAHQSALCRLLCEAYAFAHKKVRSTTTEKGCTSLRSISKDTNISSSTNVMYMVTTRAASLCATQLNKKRALKRPFFEVSYALKELKGEKETFAPFTEGKQPPPYGALRVHEVP